MKYLLIIGLFLICSLCSFAQEKKDSKIIVTVSDTANLFNRLVIAFYDKGYSLENKDAQAGFVSTNEKPIKNTVGSMKVKALIKDATITFTGWMAVDVQQEIFGVKLERTFEPVTFMGEKNGSYKVCWREMESIAKQFGALRYSK